MFGCSAAAHITAPLAAVVLFPLVTSLAVAQESGRFTAAESSRSSEIMLAQQADPAPMPPMPPTAPAPVATEPTAPATRPAADPVPLTIPEPSVVSPEPATDFTATDVPEQPSPTPRRRNRFRTASRSTSRTPLVRLTSLPNMFGDSFGVSNQLWLLDAYQWPPTGGFARAAEHL